MFKLFTTGIVQERNNTPPSWQYVRQRFNESTTSIRQYCQDSSRYVNPKHILMNLLTSMATDLSQDVENVYFDAQYEYSKLSIAERMTSSASRGSCFNNQFYGPKVTELLVVDNEAFDYELEYDNWKDIVAVKVLSHPFVDNHPTFFLEKCDKDDLAVFSIHIAKLAIQFKAYIENTGSSDMQEFIARMVLPNILVSHFEQVWFNRLFHHVCGTVPVFDKTHRLPLTVSHPEHKYTQTEMAVVENLNRLTTPNIHSIASYIPGLSQDDCLLEWRLPDVLPTAQITWALDACRLKHLVLLMTACGGSGATTDRDIVLQAIRSIEHNNVEAMLRQLLPTGIYNKQIRMIEYLRECAKR
jgi:hypothetical protein